MGLNLDAEARRAACMFCRPVPGRGSHLHSLATQVNLQIIIVAADHFQAAPGRASSVSQRRVGNVWILGPRG